MPLILIFGGGISGLTAAHELINKGFEVKLFEAGNTLGGMAKSDRLDNGMPTEHSWRGYAPFYKNTFQLMKNIPIDNHRSVYDNLSLPINFYLLRDAISTYKPDLSYSDYIFTGYYGLKYLTSNQRRNKYYETLFVPLIENVISKNGYDKLVEFATGPGFGMEKSNVSYGHFFKVVLLSTLNQDVYTHTHHQDNKDNKNNTQYTHHAKDSWHVMNQPTNEAWFDPWEKYLIKKGVDIFLNTRLVRFNYENNKIISAVVEKNGTISTIKGDQYILCTDPFSAEKIFQRSNLLSLEKQHELLNEKSVSNQISFRIGIKKEIKFPINSIAFVMTDSEFNITWYPQEEHWKNNI